MPSGVYVWKLRTKAEDNGERTGPDRLGDAPEIMRVASYLKAADPRVLLGLALGIHGSWRRKAAR